MRLVPLLRASWLANLFVYAIALAPRASAADLPGTLALAVSPGAVRASPPVGSSCPTFSWALADDAEGYELVVLDLADPERPQPVVEKSFGKGTSGWTPSGGECLAAGGTYAWTVRPLTGEAVWSTPLRFRVPGAPSAEELAAALAVLERWRAAGEPGGTGGDGGRGEESAPGRTSRNAARRVAETPDASGISAIRGENPASSGANYGITGVSSSAAGAGLVAINTTAGPDLILDGVANSEADTLLSQNGIDRPAAGAQTFDIENSGGGGMALRVQGAAVSLVGHSHAGEEISSGTVADAVIAATLTRDDEVMPIVLANDGPGSGLDADSLGGVASASYQVRVTGTCPAGQSLQGINDDGSVVCFVLGAPPVVSVVDDPPAGAVGSFTSLAIGTDGFPVISYMDDFVGHLKVAKCNDAACAGGDETITTVDAPVNDVGYYTSITIGADGFPVISYFDISAGNLKVAKCDDEACAGGNEIINTVDASANVVGAWSSIAISPDGFPVISYQDDTAFTLKVVKCDDAACAPGGETFTTVDDPPVNHVGYFPSLAIGTDGFPVISYLDDTAFTLKVARCFNAGCSGGAVTITTVDDPPANSVGRYTSLAIGTDGFPVISYQDFTAAALKVAKCNDASCFGGDETITTIDDPSNQVGTYTSLAIGTDGFPVISYWDNTASSLKVAKCNDAACSSSRTITTVDDPSNSVGQFTSLAIGTDGFPVISYRDPSAGALKVMKCHTASCFAP